MTAARSAHTAALLNDGTVLLAGGAINSDSRSVEVFDPTTNKFAPTGSMQTARSIHTATRLNNNQVLVTGGLSEMQSNLVLNSAELYK